MIATFFGHRDTPAEVYSLLLATITDLIENQNTNVFFVGNEGNFDHMVRRILKMLSREYPHIIYSVMLAYHPKEYDTEKEIDTCLLECLINVPKRYAIDKRNRWLVENSDTVVTYVKYSYGGAAKFKALAEKKGKRVIELSNDS